MSARRSASRISWRCFGKKILAVIAKHVQVDRDKVNVTMERGEHVTTLEVDIEIPMKAGVRAA